MYINWFLQLYSCLKRRLQKSPSSLNVHANLYVQLLGFCTIPLYKLSISILYSTLSSSPRLKYRRLFIGRPCTLVKYTILNLLDKILHIFVINRSLYSFISVNRKSRFLDHGYKSRNIFKESYQHINNIISDTVPWVLE